MRFQLILSAFLIIFLLTSEKGCKSGEEYPNTMLWKISGKSLEKPSYVFGTIHVMDNRAFSFNDSVLKKLDQCSTVALEIDLGGNFQEELGRSMMYKGDTTLRDFYSEEEYYSIISSVKEQIGLEESRIKKFRPFAVLMLMAQSPLEMDRSRAVDQYLHVYAEKQEKKINGIERIEEQIKALKTIGPDDLLEYVRNIDRHKHELEQLVKAYQEEDLGKIHAMIEEDPGFLNKKIMFTERNEAMANRISRMMQEEPTFAAIGSGHLPGKDGVLALLKKKGYTVEPVVAPKADTVPVLETAMDWQEFAPETAPFSVLMPGEPKENVVSRDVSAGELKVYTYMYQGSGGGRNFAYGVTVSDYAVLGLDGESISEGQRDMIYSRAKTNFISQTQGKLVNDSTFHMHGNRGRIYHILVNNGEALIRLRTIFIGSHMYIVQVMCPADHKRNDEADKFFSSFEVTP